jgi:predicted ATPase/DNA-binding CsgD family transcriptional regulator
MARSSAAKHDRHNLKAEATALVGRDQDVANVLRLVLGEEGRLVTLTGVGGCGKTRLALGVGSALVGSFKDGVWLVALAPVADPLLLPQAVAAVLGVRERTDRSLLDGLVAHLKSRQLLLVLDNCEHLLEACAELAGELLQGCPTLRLLVTSREPLRISGELAWRVPSLASPDPRAIEGPDEVVRYPAVQLFMERARSVQSDFAVTQRTASTVAAICAQLEGLPLAIELAAAWVRALGVEQIQERLGNVSGLLVGGSRSAPRRQQTMRATLDWSRGLLAVPERLVFQRSAVFVGGWSLEAAEAVCSDTGVGPQEVLYLLTRLVDASLVQVDDVNGRARYRLLEPVRQYAHEYLLSSGEADVIRRQHATFFASFAQQLETDANVGGPGREAAHAALELEQDNLRAAMRWCLEHGEAEIGLGLVRAHWNLWVVRGRLTEGRGWATQVAALPEADRKPSMRAVALSIAATLAYRQGDVAEAVEIYREALPLLEQGGEIWVMEVALMDLGFIALYQGEYRAAHSYFSDCLAATRTAGHRINEALALNLLGWVATQQADYATGRVRREESLALARAVGDSWAISVALSALGHVLLRQGELAAARRLLEEGVTLQRQIGERFMLAYTLDALGQLATQEGHFTEARAALRESLRLREDMGDSVNIPESLESIAALAVAEKQPERAVELAGAAAGLRHAMGAPLHPIYGEVRDTWLVPLRKRLGEDATTRAWEVGRTTPIDKAVELAVATTDAAPAQPKRAAELSPREQEVAALLADGLSNRQIAERLVVTERTVAAHIEHILNKLGFASRHQVGAWAADHGLVT